MSNSEIPYTTKGFLRGFRLCIPLALGVFSYGLVFGMLAEGKEMTFQQTLLMSLSVFAGASQLIATELWTHPLSSAELILTTFVVNARHLLMGASLQPWLRTLSPFRAYGSLFFCVDESWALFMRELKKGERDAAFLVGAGFSIYLAWSIATCLGFFGGTVIKNPASLGLDFAFTAVFITLALGLWQGRRDLVPWLVAAITAIITNQLLPGKWYILVGAILGSSVEAIRHDK
jgi:4-azaleucine resistance transporter AzlC